MATPVLTIVYKQIVHAYIDIDIDVQTYLLEEVLHHVYSEIDPHMRQ